MKKLGSDKMQADPSELRESTRLAWAKSGLEYDVPNSLWLPLVGHCMDACDVAGFLWDEWLTKSQKKLLAKPFRGQSDNPQLQAKQFLMLAAGMHDCGKLSPPFALQVTAFADKMRNKRLSMAHHGTLEAQNTRWFKHGLAGAMLIERFGEQERWDQSIVTALATLAGGHHGVPLQSNQRAVAVRQGSLLGTPDSAEEWKASQDELLGFLVDYVGSDVPFVNAAFDLPSLVLYQGCVTISDWIASSTEFFPLTKESDTTFAYLTRKGGQNARVREALARFRLPASWVPEDEGQTATELLQSRFGFDFPARPLQDAAVAAARSARGSALIIIEDAMGSGKTEAALLAAEILAKISGMSGLLVAMPSQATTDAMFARIMRYLNVSLRNLSSEADSGREKSVALLHGRANWSQAYGELKRTGRMLLDRSYADFDFPLGQGQIDLDREDYPARPVISHPWFRGRYAAILSSFVTTTVDHLLMGALSIKQQPVRHLGLSGKVVILDEAHASSDFMNFFATRVLEWLGAYGVPVVILSATLTSELREQLISAYETGLRLHTDKKDPTLGATTPATPQLPPSPAPQASAPATKSDAEPEPYPRLTVTDRDGTRMIPLEPASSSRQVTMRAHDPSVPIADVVKEVAAGRRGNILAVCNTVREAQATFEELERVFGNAVRLVHARFTASDRLANDAELLRLYGPDGQARPEFSIVVGTQVLEQSLDIDFDVLVTQLAPMDLLLQRVGRTHRHSGRTRPEEFADPVCHVTDVPLLDREPELHRGSRTVYRPHKLLAAAAVLGADAFTNAGRPVVLPNDIGPTVEAAARVGTDGPDAWSDALINAVYLEEKALRNAEAAVRNTLLTSPGTRLGTNANLDDWLSVVGDPESRDRAARAKVREGIEDEEVILLIEDDSGFRTMPTAEAPEGLPLPTGLTPNYETALAAAMGTVRIPSYHCESDAALDALEATWHAAWDQSPLLKGQLFLPLRNGVARFAGRTLTYSRDLGLEIAHDH